MRTTIACSVTALFVISACGTDPTGTTSGATTAGEPTCESTGKRLCERACACGTDGKCKTGFKGTAGALTTLTWSGQSDCEGGFAGSRCAKGGPAGVDFAKCEADINAAACEGDVFIDPPSCEAKRDGG